MMNNRFKIEESLSISDTVVKLTQMLREELLARVNSKKMYHKYNNDIISNGIFNFDTKKLLDIPIIKIKYCFYFLNLEQYNYKKKYNQLEDGGITDFKNKTIILNLTYITDTEQPSTEFDSVIQHEMNHFYQNLMGATKNEDFYNRIIDLCKNGDKEEKAIAYALYLAFNTEIDSFANQYYAFLKQNNIQKASNGMDYYSLSKENPYSIFNNAFEYVDSLDINENKLIKTFGLTINQLYSILNNADKRLYKKMSKVWTKYMTENKYFMDLDWKRIGRMCFLNECYKHGIIEEDEDYF